MITFTRYEECEGVITITTHDQGPRVNIYANDTPVIGSGDSRSEALTEAIEWAEELLDVLRMARDRAKEGQ